MLFHFLRLLLWLRVRLLPSAESVSTVGATGTIKDIEHVVLFMQENRAFDHYFGSMAGVRGFADPNVHITQDGRPVWFQKVDATLSNATKELLPFYINAAGGNISDATQYMEAGSNGEGHAIEPAGMAAGWTANHNALNNGENNLWAVKNTPFSWGHFKRHDIPTHFALADAWTIADMYMESVIASTNPNRATWMSGSINIPGGPQSPEQGGVVIDNNEIPGCEAPNVDCYPLKWKTYPEFMEEANVTWQVYQDVDNFDDNALAWFEQFQNAPAWSSLARRGMSFLGLQGFYDAAAAGTLPEVSYIIGPTLLSEHPPFSPRDGAWLQQQVTNAVIRSPKYNSTALFISYDETGGFGDHVVPIAAPPNTPGEWLTNPRNASEVVFAGPGFRIPLTVISPWTRGGNVFTAFSDHNSQILFLEKWLASKGKTVVTDQMNSWRREHMSDLVQMFDFEHPDLTIPELPAPPPPAVDSRGKLIGYLSCLENFPDPQPPIPYGSQTRENSLHIETGFKSVRGALTEGRYLVFESQERALTFDTGENRLSVGVAIPSHDLPEFRVVLHATSPPPATNFNLQFVGSEKKGFAGPGDKLSTSKEDASVFNITDMGSGRGYTVRDVESGKFLTIVPRESRVAFSDRAETFKVFSVTKSTDSGKGI